MSLDFAADWLSLREPADHASRSRRVTAAAAAHLSSRPAALVVDLGCGRGSGLRYLRPHLEAGTRWRLIDRDPALLAEARATLDPGEAVEPIAADLRTADLRALVAGADLVTAAAVLDLVGRPWLEDLVDACAAAGAALLATGNVDGRIGWLPVHAGDAAMIAAFLAHHGGDKGFGRALGSTAPAVLQTLLRADGWAVTAATADWDLGPDYATLQRAYLAGAVQAIEETGADAARLASWAAARTAALDDGTSRLHVGHVDVLGVPPSRT